MTRTINFNSNITFIFRTPSAPPRRTYDHREVDVVDKKRKLLLKGVREIISLNRENKNRTNHTNNRLKSHQTISIPIQRNTTTPYTSGNCYFLTNRNDHILTPKNCLSTPCPNRLWSALYFCSTHDTSCLTS